MAKSTKAQQVSTGTPDSYTPEELADPTPPIRIQRAMLGAPPKEDASSVGTDSSRSSENANTKSGKENPSLPPPVQTTENPSGQPEKETGSTVVSTVGDGQTQQESKQSDEEKKHSPAKKAAAKKARVRSTGDDDDFSLLE